MSQANLDLRKLESFREVVRTGSFTAAAKRLHMTQPAISLHVKALEQELGAHLMDRDGRGIALTPAGEALLEAAEHAFAALEEGARRVREIVAPEHGTVVLACGDTVALHLLPPVLRAFRKQYREAEVAIHNHGSREIIEQVLRREADLGIVTRPPYLAPELWARTVRADPLRLILPKRHPLASQEDITLADLHEQPSVWLAKPTETRSLIDRTLRAAGVEPRSVMESGNLEVVKAYVAEGLGLSIVPEMALSTADRRRLAVRPLPSTMPARKLAVIRRKDRRPGLLARALLALIAEHLLVEDEA